MSRLTCACVLAAVFALTPGCSGDDADDNGSGGEGERGDGGPDANTGGAATSSDVPPPDELADLFERLWGEPDAVERDAILKRIFASDGKLVDALSVTEGRAAVGALIDGWPRDTHDGCAVDELAVVEDHMRFTATCFGLGDLPDEHYTKHGHLDADGRLDLIVIFGDPIAAVATSRDLATVTTMADEFEDSWTEADDTAREALLRSIMVEDAFYLDPGGRTEGVAAISERMAMNLVTGAGGALWDYLEVTGGPQEQQGYLRFGVRGINDDGSLAFVGEKFAPLTGPDKFSYIVYFPGTPMPAGDADAGAP